MPRPVDGTRYVRGWDGIRALAVIAVVGYHLGAPGLSGGLLGVGVFFTLSGFLITGILDASQRTTGSFQLKRFWIRRARRLLPALVVVLTVVLAATALADPARLGVRLRESLAAMAYVANWTTIADGVSYFERFSGPGPLDHLWSLSVEEQFYLVWPLALVLAIRVLRLDRPALVLWVVFAALVSFALLATLAAPGFDHTRAYEGTDTRVGGMLVGAAFALSWPWLSGWLKTSRWARRAAEAGGVLGLVVIAALVGTTDDYSMSIYRGGLLLLSVATALLTVAVTVPGSALGWLLGVAPLRWIGERSYGIYLWHLPVIVFVSGASVAEFSLRTAWLPVVLTLGAAELSWRLVEDPIRRLGFRGAFRATAVPGWGGRLSPRLAAVVMVATGTAVLYACAHAAPTAPTPTGILTADGMPPLPPPEAALTSGGHDTGRRPDASPSAVPTTAGRPTTSCRRVVHVGDSTSIGLVTPAYLPALEDRLPAQLRRVGVRHVTTDVLGARSIVETYHDQPNARSAVTSRMEAGYDGCWTIAMGTNEAANQAVGGVYPFDERIDMLMEPIGDQPVLWLTVRSLLHSGPYGDGGMAAFSQAVVAACDRYPNLRVYDWRTEVLPDWFIPDGIHFTTPGYRARARGIAQALAAAFPAGADPATGCIVHADAPRDR